MLTSKHVKRTYKRANKGANKDVIKQANKKRFLRRTNVDVDLVSIVPLDWSTNDTCAIKQNS